MNLIYKEIKIHEPKNFHKYKRLENLSYEITRLNCVLKKGMVSKKMFDELVLKLSILENEFKPLFFFLISKANKRESGMSYYHVNYLCYVDENKQKIYRKFKLKKCGWCENLIFDEMGFCEDLDCESHEFLSDSSDDE